MLVVRSICLTMAWYQKFPSSKIDGLNFTKRNIVYQGILWERIKQKKWPALKLADKDKCNNFM